MSIRPTPDWTHLSNSPRLVREHAGEHLALRALVAAERARGARRRTAARQQLVHPHAQQRVHDGEQADGERAVVLGAVERPGHELAQARAQEADLEQVRRAVVDAREHEQRRPAADGDRAERHQRLADRADAVAAAVEGGVRELDELERRGPGPRRSRARAARTSRPCPRRASTARAGGRSGRTRPWTIDRLREVLALEGVEAEAAAEAVDGARRDAVGDHLQPAPARGVDVGLDLLLARPATSIFTLSARSSSASSPTPSRKPSSAIRKPASRISRSTVSSSSSTCSSARDLQHHALGVQRQRARPQQELTRDVHVRGPVAHQLEQADVGDRLGQHARGRLVRVRLGRASATRSRRSARHCRGSADGRRPPRPRVRSPWQSECCATYTTYRLVDKGAVYGADPIVGSAPYLPLCGVLVGHDRRMPRAKVRRAAGANSGVAYTHPAACV